MIYEMPVLWPQGALSNEDKLEKALTSKFYVSERKLDGVRFLARKEMNGEVHFTSRQKSKKTGLPTDKTNNFPHLVELVSKLPNGSCIDGEIITSINCTSKDVTRITGAKQEKAIERQKENGFVKYVAYDILYFNGESLLNKRWSERRLKLEYAIEKYIGLENKYIILSTYIECHKHNVDEWFSEIVAHGGEGLVIKNKNAYYFPGKKPSDNWIKMKKHDTYDAIVTGYKDPEMIYTGKETENPFGYWQFWMDKDTGEKFNMPSYRMCDAPDNWIPVTRFYFYDWIGSIEISQYKNGKLVKIGKTSGMSDDVRRYFTENKDKMLDTVIEVEAMLRFPDTGYLRDPRYIQMRPDKSAEDCIWNEY